MARSPLSVVQISDIHLFKDTAQALLGVKTEASFQAVFELLRQHKEAVDLIILSGDLSQDGSAESYERLAGMFNQLNVPVYFVPGNHDDAKTLASVYPAGMMSDNRHLVFKKWQLILLDSHIDRKVEGYLDGSQLRFLQTCLTMQPDHHAAIFFHHHPFAVGSEWLDKLGLKNADELFDVVSHYQNVKHVIFGHVHQEIAKHSHGVHCYSAPSTCFQFKPASADFALDKMPPGFRWLHFHDDGRLETKVHRVAEYVGDFDVHAKGY